MRWTFTHRRLAEKVKAGLRAAGGTPMEFNTIAVSDGVSMGTSGMKTSLVSREVVADSIELVARGHLFDGVVALSGCDKTIPGTVMALARLNVPGVMLYGGSIAPGRLHRHDLPKHDVVEAVATSGGSTNAVLHLLAVATEAGVDLKIDDFDRIAEKTPQLCSLKPSGEFLAVDLYEAGGIMLVAQRLAELGLLHEDALTV